MRAALLLLTALALASCRAGAQEQATILPTDAAVLPGSAAGQMLHQCSRAVPEPGEAAWQPEVGDIAALEQALPAALHGRPEAKGPLYPADRDWARVPLGWQRQYVGLVRDGRRYVYGNYFPRQDDQPPNWQTQPVAVCDGGPVFFGIEWDVEARRFTHIAFNGALG
jgi:hypothetical protein